VFCTSIMIIFAVVGLFQYIVASEQLGKQLYHLIVSWNMSRNMYLFFTLVFLLLMGCVLDAVPVMLIFFPVMLPVATGLGIDPVHYGVIYVLNLMIGLITPPVGALLFIQTKIAKVSINALVRELLPHIGVLILVLIAATYIPQIVLWLPNLIL